MEKRRSTNVDGGTLLNSGEIYSLIANKAATSRAAILDACGLSRVTVTQRLNELLSAGLIRETADTMPSGGRPTRVLGLNHTAGYILAASIGESRIHLAALDLQPAIVAQETVAFSEKQNPQATLTLIADRFAALARGLGDETRVLAGIGLSLPTPVDSERGCVVGPSILPGWDEFDIAAFLQTRFTAPVYVENDVNLMTIYEHRHNFPQVNEMFFIKVGTGIGSGIITGGRIFRGARGAAGDIGHIQFAGDCAPLCRCGKFGCVEARAAGWAIGRDLTQMGHQAGNARDVVALVENNVPEAIMYIRKAGQTIGEVTSNVVSILNPSLIVVGGTLARCGEFLLSGVRELVYQRCLPLATRDLQIVLRVARTDSALYGAAYLVLDEQLSSRHADNFLTRYVDNLARSCR
ncbi:ROK family protein [Sodalis sp. RH21]|uniref:ROK family transcriptional regulator n=1 Tax=unclassified Sodalis (in: enterobacteria) TaxID=2636512 RepID=UPI0039B3C997